MTTPLGLDPFDRSLRDALATRTRPQPDDARLLAAILSTTGVVAQERPGWRLPVWPRPAVVGLVGLVLVGVTAALLAGTMLRMPTALPGNGPIVVSDGSERYAIDPDSGDRLPASATPALRVTGWWDADWSPDGQRLATSDAAGVRIADVDALSPALARAALACGDPVYCSLDWFPDGRTLAVATGRAIVRLDPAADDVEVVHEATGDIDQLREVATSPDGRHIAYATFDATGTVMTLRTLDLDTRIETILATRDADWIPFVGLTWSPDGASLFALTAAAFDTPPGGGDRDATGNQLQVEQIDAVTGATVRTTATGTCFCVGLSPGFALAPDGTSFVVVADYATRDTSFSMTRYPVAGGDPVVLVDGVNGMPAWQPIP